MTLSVRVASIATVATLCAAALVGATAPSLAEEADRPAIDTPNVTTALAVPTPPPPIVPSSWTPETGDVADAAPVTAVEAGGTDFDSLAQAVAAQTVPAELDPELRCLAIGVFYESKGEPLKGQLAVANVILNRARSGRFPETVCGVLKQRGQFSFVRGGRLPNRHRGRRAWKTAIAVARVARQGLWESPVPKALFFHARHVSPGWRLARVGTVGNHIFYR